MSKSKSFKYPALQDKRVYELKPEHTSHTVGSSKTVPDETLSIRQIMSKHVKGINAADDLYRTPVYNNGDFDDIDMEAALRTELSDRTMLVTKLAIENARKKYAAQQAYAQKLAEQAALKSTQSTENPDANSPTVAEGKSEASDEPKKGGTSKSVK